MDQASQITACRLTTPPDLKGRSDRVALYASSYGVIVERHSQVTVARSELFQVDPSMEVWATGVRFLLSMKGVDDG